MELVRRPSLARSLLTCPLSPSVLLRCSLNLSGLCVAGRSVLGNFSSPPLGSIPLTYVEMRPRWTVAVLLALALGALEASAGSERLQLRDDPPPPPSSSPTPSAAPSSSSEPPSSSAAPSSTPPPSSSAASSADLSSSQDATSKDTTSTSSLPSTSITSLAAAPTNGTNSTLPDGLDPDALPLPPEITPALGVAGALLIQTSHPLAFIGIKNKYVQIFLSAGYLVALAITVLVLYVMVPPISLAVQGAYFIGAFIPAIGLGGVSLVFRDVTEGLGCAVGGFALSMFFLVLKPGGLIGNTAGKALFIGCFTVAVYAMSFSHYTRSYALIGSTSLGGSTALILGIDCFSRAGLKEFWVYIWALNDKLFPLLIDSYPITRGMRVEIAGLVVFAFFSVLSQLKIWKVIQAKRNARELERQEANRQRDELEEELGQRIEAGNASERKRWEQTYGDGKDSGIGTEDNSTWKDSKATSFDETKTARGAAVTTIELEELPSRPSGSEAGGSKESFWLGEEDRSRSKASVAQAEPEESWEFGLSRALNMIGGVENLDKIQPAEPPERSASPVKQEAPTVTITHAKGGDTPKKEMKKRRSREPGPEVVPLPFRVPTTEDARDDDMESNATFASSQRDTKRLSHRLSGAHLTKRLSTLSARSKNSQLSIYTSPSAEALMDVERSPRTPSSSVFAVEDGADGRSVASNDDDTASDRLEGPEGEKRKSVPSPMALKKFDFELPNDTLQLPTADDASSRKRDSTSKRDSASARSPTRVKFDLEASAAGDSTAERAQSVKSKSSGKPASSGSKKGRISKQNLDEMLPSGASRVVLQYRTN